MTAIHHQHLNSSAQNAKGCLLNAELVHSDRNQLSMATLEDVENAVEYLAGDLSAYVSGQNLPLNGGVPSLGESLLHGKIEVDPDTGLALVPGGF